jgi:hypothetical protein
VSYRLVRVGERRKRQRGEREREREREEKGSQRDRIDRTSVARALGLAKKSIL